MTGADLRAIRERMGLDHDAWGRALGYGGRNPDSARVSACRAESMTEVPGPVARLAEMYERHGVPKRYLGS